MAVGGASGAGIGKGQPIWPNQKSEQSQNQDNPFVLDKTAESKSTSAMAEVTAAGAADNVSETVEVKRQTKTWQVSSKDLVQQLIKLGIPKTDLNKSMALMMMEYGLELSEDNFALLQKMLKGKTSPANLEAAVVSLAKGTTQEASVEFLSQFLANRGVTADQLFRVLSAMKQFQAALGGTKALDAGIISGLVSILSELDIELKKLLKKAKGDSLSLENFRRNGLIKDVYSLKQLLSGISDKFKLPISDPALQASLRELQARLHDLLSGLTSQAILSKDSDKQPFGALEKFAYWQIPNMMGANVDQNIDILIKKDAMKKDTIDPARTKIILRFETEELGEVSIIMTIMDKKIWYLFHSDLESTSKMISSFQKELSDQMSAIDYSVVGFQSIRKKIDIKKYMLPTQNLDELIRINAEV